MLEIKDAAISKKIRNGEMSMEELGSYLLDTFPVKQIACELAGYYIDDNFFNQNKVILTPKQQEMLRMAFEKIARPLYLDKGRKPRTEKYLKLREAI